MELNTQTEINILEAAENVFYRKGKDGTSMQDIADEAGITRTSLNYYYRSKDKLFEAVFKSAMKSLIPELGELMNSDLPFKTYIPKMVELIIDNIIKKPQIPVFVLQELSSNPGRLHQVWMELGINPAELVEKMNGDKIFSDFPVDPRHIIMNIISMCIFPFAAKPILLPLMFHGDEKAYIEAMKQRKVIITELIEKMF